MQVEIGRTDPPDPARGWSLACPTCRNGLRFRRNEERSCEACDVVYQQRSGIWELLAKDRAAGLRTFVEEYEVVRSAEGRKVQDAAHLRALPFRDLSRKRAYEWAIRARSFRSLVDRVVRPLEREAGEPLRILDLGSGLGWLAYRLTLRGHDVAAVDLVTNDFDGLGAHRLYDRPFLTLQADFDRLPFCDFSATLVVYNASLHYASNFASTLTEALRVLRPGGRVAILDTPIYRDPSSGGAMIREREDDSERRFGFRGDSPRSEGFLTYQRLAALGSELDVRWDLFEPWYGIRWWLKPAIARLRGAREPARFKVIVARRSGDK